MRETSGTAEIIELLHKNHNKSCSVKDLIGSDSARFNVFSRNFDGLLLDFSRTSIDAEAFDLLISWAERSGVAELREQMFAGQAINNTECRPVLHALWRSREFTDLLSPEEALACEQALQRMSSLAEPFHRGYLPSTDGVDTIAIRHIIHVGIGGSLLGPRLLCEVFPADRNCPEVHFISSVDAFEREQLLARINPAETAIVLVSKSFTTSEVLAHARRLQQWQAAALQPDACAQRQFAVTAMPSKAVAFGVPPAHIMEMGEWTGGRFSLWSPVGFTAAIRMGPDAFARLCAGGAAMDNHFRNTPLRDNLPVIHGMLSCWHRNICAHSCRGIVPYDSRLKGLPGWLQQVQMESNGKSVTRAGLPVKCATSPVVFGDCGTDAQHALFQAFHQGTEIVPLDFVGVIRPDHSDHSAQTELLAHLLAQASALAFGRDAAEVRENMQAQAVPDDKIESLVAHREMPGNRPSSVILLDELRPESLGMLLVLYEHSVFVESIVWGINAFDQWGVELGKELAANIAPSLAGTEPENATGVAGLGSLVTHIRQRW